MNSTKNPPDTGDRLRALMRSHIQNTATLERPLAVSPAPSIEPPKAPPPAAAARAVFVPSSVSWSPRYSLRLLPTELSKINSIINSTLHATGERVTLTDILRVGLSRMGDLSAIKQEEIKALRATDGRRTKAAV